MPLYEYEVRDDRSGEVLARVTLARAVEERDGVSLRRAAVPERVGVASGQTEEQRTGQSVLRTYQRLEQRLGSTREFQRRIGHTPEQVKRAWAGE